MHQLALDLAPTRVDPMTCPHRLPFRGIPDRWICAAHDGTAVNCMQEICGEPPSCCYEPIDNSTEAVARRLEWIKEHEKKEQQ